MAIHVITQCKRLLQGRDCVILPMCGLHVYLITEMGTPKKRFSSGRINCYEPCQGGRSVGEASELQNSMR